MRNTEAERDEEQEGGCTGMVREEDGGGRLAGRGRVDDARWRGRWPSGEAKREEREGDWERDGGGERRGAREWRRDNGVWRRGVAGERGVRKVEEGLRPADFKTVC